MSAHIAVAPLNEPEIGEHAQGTVKAADRKWCFS
jgi:hypothetical protein